MKDVLLLSIPILKQGTERLSSFPKVTQGSSFSLWFQEGQRDIAKRGSHGAWSQASGKETLDSFTSHLLIVLI